MKKSLPWLWSLLAVVIALTAGLNVLAYKHAHAMMHFTNGPGRLRKPEDLSFKEKANALFSGVSIPRPVSAHQPEDLAPDCATLAIAGTDDVTLAAWYVNRGKATPLVILFHGYCAEKTSLLNEARGFLELDTSVLLVDFRGSGGSSEAYTTIGVREADDVVACTQYAHEHLAHPEIILFGQSMGAVAILRAVYVQDLAPDAVILEAVFDTMFNTVCNRFEVMHVPSFPSAPLLMFWAGQQWHQNSFAHNPVEYAQALTCPALFLHGAEDPRAKLEEGRRVYAAAPGTNKTFVVFNNVGHASYVTSHPAEWKAAVNRVVTCLE